tara:strand:+ start:1491 stop:2054 length:564 start_codon:yes stop_codon:yes gene_type:complete
VWGRIQEVVAKSLIAGEDTLCKACGSLVKQRSHAFEILGYDLLFDQEMQPYLLEINHTPSLSPHTQLENNVKQRMLNDLFPLVDVKNERKVKVKRALKALLPVIEGWREMDNFPAHLEFLRNAKDREVWVIADTLLERQSRGHYKIVLPDPAFARFEIANRNALLNQWVEKELTFQDILPGFDPHAV